MKPILALSEMEKPSVRRTMLGKIKATMNDTFFAFSSCLMKLIANWEDVIVVWLNLILQK